MVQQTQPNVSQLQEPVMPAQQPVVAQPAGQPAMQVQSGEGNPIWKKWWLWVVIAIIVGVGIYFLLK